MTDPASSSEAGPEPRARPDAGSRPPMPRWVKVFGLIALVLVVAVLTLMLTGVLGEHGPGRHLPGGDKPERHTPPIEHGP